MEGQCVKCGRHAEGARFKFYFGKHMQTTSTQTGALRTTTARYRIAGSEDVFLCSACQIADKHQQIWKEIQIWVLVAAVGFGVTGLLAIPAWRNALASFLGNGGVLVGGILYFFLMFGVILGLFIIPAEIAQWNKPYMAPDAAEMSPPTPSKVKTLREKNEEQLKKEQRENKGDEFAIRLRKKTLRRQGYDSFFTRMQYKHLH